MRNSTFTRQGSAVELNSVMPFVEGGVPRDITLAGNVFDGVNPMPHGAAVTVYSHTFGRGAPSLSNIVISGNTFIRPGESAIALSGVNGGVIASNRFERPLEYTALARPGEPRRQQAVWLARCADLRVDRNVLTDPGRHATRDATTGSPLLGCDSQSRNIRLDAPSQPAAGR